MLKVFIFSVSLDYNSSDTLASLDSEFKSLQRFIASVETKLNIGYFYPDLYVAFLVKVTDG
jgi:hypothetical protein